MRITLSRVVMSDGGYVSTSIDQLINKDENVTDDGIQTEAISTDFKKTGIIYRYDSESIRHISLFSEHQER